MKIKKKRKFSIFPETQSARKTWAYFVQLTKTDEFNKKVKDIRIKFNIPVDGYPLGESCPPPEWYKKPNSCQHCLSKAESRLLNNYGLFPGHWWVTVEWYIFFSELVKPTFNSGELCTFDDLAEIANDPYDKENENGFNKYYPLAIRISPYASLRDIIDFAKYYYRDIIKPSQKHYQRKEDKIARIRLRKPDIERRNDFIYKNRHLHLKTIADRLNEQFGIGLDEGHIGKIISIETRRRKKM